MRNVHLKQDEALLLDVTKFLFFHGHFRCSKKKKNSKVCCFFKVDHGHRFISETLSTAEIIIIIIMIGIFLTGYKASTKILLVSLPILFKIKEIYNLQFYNTIWLLV